MLIKTIGELQKYTTVFKSNDFGAFEIFVRDAQEKYIEPYFGYELLKVLEKKSDDELTVRICRALGPFALALSTDEFSIGFGEAGHTVTRTDSLAPASDAKIEKARESLFERAWQNLDRAIQYVFKNADEYPEWKSSDFANKTATLLFRNADDFQENGLVHIDNSPLTFNHFRLLILRIEKSETLLFLPEKLRKDIAELPEEILQPMQAYTGSRVAALHTSQSTHANRAQPGEGDNATEFKPMLRPLYSNSESSGNYFEEQAAFWKATLMQVLIDKEYIDANVQALQFNNATNKVFVANAT